ncbi:MAG: hydrogenase, partial [Deltaproteobacteria bacterium]|nr:hydrogenase [Deltaproteobacteria bacterium]
MDKPDKLARVEQDVLAAMKRPGIGYLAALGCSATLFLTLLGLWGYQMSAGMGVSGLMNPVGWGVDITNFVFWVGIAHSGTLISAVLYLFRARFRTSFNRPAEAMTVFALLVAGLF